jgi:hypothetical protein
MLPIGWMNLQIVRQRQREITNAAILCEAQAATWLIFNVA